MKRVILALFLLIIASTAFAQSIVTSDSLVIATFSTPKVRVALQGGLGYIIGAVDKTMGQDMIEYQKKLKKGLNDGVDISYFYSAGNSIGLKYSHVRSSVSAYGTFSFDDGTTQSGELSDNISLLFIGPYLGMSTLGNGSKHIFSLNAGAGYVGYKDDACVITPYTVSGWTLGYYIGLQYDFMITKTIALGAEAALFTGTITDLNKTENGTTSKLQLEKGQAQGASHLDLTLGLRFYL